MAAKRISSTSIKWADMELRVPFKQRFQFAHLKALNDTYLKRIKSLPEKVPTLNWDTYGKTIKIPGLVEDFKKQYGALQIPYPPDNVSKQIDEQEKVVLAEIEEFKKQSAATINKHKNELDRLGKLLPYSQMTMEEFNESHPDMAFPSSEKPLFWPNDAEEQIDFRDKGHPLYGTDPHGH